jgi:SnoaL-like domain
MAIIDPEQTWVPMEERLARTTNERHRQVLGIVIEHMKAEAEPDMDRLMATLSPEPDYHFWIAGQDMGPKGTEGVHAYYTAFAESGANVLVFDIERIAVDDDCVMTEGWLKVIYPGVAAQQIGVDVDDPDGDYLVVFRQLINWPIDADGLILAEDAYHTGPVSVTRLSHDDLPQKYLDQRRDRSTRVEAHA